MPKLTAQDLDRNIAMIFRTRRIEIGRTQVQMAEAIGVTYQQYYKYETGQNRITVGRLIMICKALGWSLLDFCQLLALDNYLPPAPVTTKQDHRNVRLLERFNALPDNLQVAVSAFVNKLSNTEE